MSREAHTDTDALLLVLAGGLAVCLAAMIFAAARPEYWSVFTGFALASGLLVGLLWLRGGLPLTWVLGLAAGARLMAFVLPPVLSDDAYRYIWDGLVQHEGINPYRFAPADVMLSGLHASPLFELLNSAEYFSVYPPLSQFVFFLGGWVYDGDWITSYYVIKAVFVVAEWGSVLLLSRMTSTRMLLLYALHPLVIIEVAGQGHTEALMVAALVVAVWCVRRAKPRWASVALGAAAMVKLYPLVLFPLLIRRYGWRGLWPGVLFMAGMSLPYAAVYVIPQVLESLRLYTSLFEFNAGLYFGVKELLMWVTGSDWSKTLGPVMSGAYAAALPLVYWIDARRDWPLSRAMLVVLGLFLVLTTTVHPWYLLAVLPLLPLQRRVGWHWVWLATFSMGTYMLYRPDGASWYWGFVIFGWGGWIVWAIAAHLDDAMQQIHRWRAVRKVNRIMPLLPAKPQCILDLGAGEGYVGVELEKRTGADVQLVDVLPMNRTALQHHVYGGYHLPYPDNTYDCTLLYFVLHHCESPRQVLAEALRVTNGPVIVVESVYTTGWNHFVLTQLDRLANRVRSRGAMADQEQHLDFRTVEGWLDLFHTQQARVKQVERKWNPIHRQATFVIQPHK